MDEVMEIVADWLYWFPLVIGLVGVVVCFNMVLRLVGTSVTEVLLNALQRKKTGKFPYPSEKKSRKRVQKTMSDPSLSAKEKCLFLDDELGRVMDSIFVSREWKDKISDMAGDLMKQNGLTYADFW